MLKQMDKINAIQLCINTYNGEHGKIDYSNFETDTKKSFNKENVQGFFIEQKHEKLKNVLWIVFRGSDEDEDWQDNFNFKYQPYGNKNTKIKIHNGFYEHYQLVRDIIHKKVKFKKYNNIIVTGHSLGGAIAILCAIDIQKNFNDKNIFCITGGSPKVGNIDFKKSYEKRVPNTYRLWYGEDPVTKVPPYLFFGYHHVGIPERYVNPISNVISPLFKILPIAVWNHHPLLLLNEMKKKL